MDKAHYRLRCGLLTVFLALCLLFAAQRVQAADRTEEVFVYLTDELDFSPAAACGIMGNIYHESNFNPDITNSIGAYGLCQWLGSRRTRLNSFCATRGYDVTSIQGQLQYLAYELKTYYPAVNRYLKKVANTAAGAYNAASYFCKHFEIPENANAYAKIRGNRAKKVYWPKFGASSMWAYGWNGSQGIYMKWTGSGASYYEIWRSTKAKSGFRKIGSISGSYHSCGDPYVTVGKKYYYYIVATNKSGTETARSNTISVTRESNVTDSACVITLSGTSFAYTGNQIRPDVTVTYGKDKDMVTLTEGTDYTVSYGKNQDAGNGTVTVKGEGRYGGTRTLTFEITGLPVTISVSDMTAYLARKSITPKITIDGPSEIDYTLTSSNKAAVKVSGKKLKLVGPGRSRITVKTEETGGCASAQASFWLYVRPKKVSLKKVSSSSSGVTVTWKAAAKVTGYEIEYTQNASFDDTSGTVRVSGAARKKKTFSLGKGTWKVRIRAYKRIRAGVQVTGLWSKALTVKVK